MARDLPHRRRTRTVLHERHRTRRTRDRRPVPEWKFWRRAALAGWLLLAVLSSAYAVLLTWWPTTVCA